MEEVTLRLADFSTVITVQLTDLTRLSSTWDKKATTITVNRNEYTVPGTFADVIAAAAGVYLKLGQRLTLRPRLRGRL